MTQMGRLWIREGNRQAQLMKKGVLDGLHIAIIMVVVVVVVVVTPGSEASRQHGAVIAWPGEDAREETCEGRASGQNGDASGCNIRRTSHDHSLSSLDGLLCKDHRQLMAYNAKVLLASSRNCMLLSCSMEYHSP